MSVKLRQMCFLSLCVLMGPMSLFSGEYKASLARMPVYALSPDEGVLVDFVKAMAQVTNNTISIKVQPFASSVYMAQKGRVDFHMPLIKNEIKKDEDLPFTYATDTMFHVNFVVYSNKNSGVTLENIATKKVETDRAHVEYFPFKITPSNSIVKSLKKVNDGTIDAFVFADFATDPNVKALSLNNIKRDLYKTFDSKIVLPKNERGKDVDKMLSVAIAALKKNGKFQELMGPIDLAYNNWQP